MRIVIHAGYNKAGSTSIQDFLFSRRKALLHHGVLYPETGVVDRGHRGLSRHFVGQPTAPEVPIGPKFITQLREEIALHLPRILVLSSEYLIQAGVPQIKNLKNELSSHPGEHEFAIVFYLRRHDAWLESSFNQAERTTANPPWAPDIRSFIIHALGQWRNIGNYPAVLGRWAKVFGKGCVVVRPFEARQFINQSLSADILSQIDPMLLDVIDWKNVQGANNESLPGDLVTLVGTVQRSSLPDPMKRQIVGQIISAAPPAAREKTHLLSRHERASLAAAFAPQYRVIAKNYLGRENGILFLEKG
jgi:hypothetical protein